MSDANVDLGATNLFSLSANFHAQSSSSEAFSSEELALSAVGNKSCTNEHNKGTNYSATYKYCGTNLTGNLGTIATAFGAVLNAKLVTGLSISYPGPGQQAEITVTGHNHTTNAHSATTNPPNTFNIASIIGTTGLGVPALIAVAGTNSSPMSGSLDFSLNHIDKEGNAGHFVGESITCRCDMSQEYEGNKGAVTAGNWLQILATASDGNEDTDTSAVTAHQFIDAT